jgi:hypothetical protein
MWGAGDCQKGDSTVDVNMEFRIGGTKKVVAQCYAQVKPAKPTAKGLPPLLPKAVAAANVSRSRCCCT